MAFFETLMIKRTISVEMIITLLQQMILCDYITDVSRNLTFIIFIADGNFMKLKRTTNFTTVKDLIFSGHVELAHLLLEQGANVENRTKKGYTPFFLASKEVRN